MSRQLGRAFADEVEIVGEETWEQAAGRPGQERDEALRHGKEAAPQRLRDCVLSRLPRFSAAAS